MPWLCTNPRVGKTPFPHKDHPANLWTKKKKKSHIDFWPGARFLNVNHKKRQNNKDRKLEHVGFDITLFKN